MITEILRDPKLSWRDRNVRLCALRIAVGGVHQGAEKAHDAREAGGGIGLARLELGRNGSFGRLLEFLPMAAARFADPHPVTLPREQSPHGCPLPVISRIVRRTPFEGEGMLLRALREATRAARAVGKSTLGSMVIVGVLLAALGASAGVALRCLAGAPPAVASAPPVSVAPLAPAVLPPAAFQESPPADVPTEENSLAGEPVARFAMTARATPPLPRVRGQQRSDHRVTHGRIHPTSARPGARRLVTSKPKLR